MAVAFGTLGVSKWLFSRRFVRGHPEIVKVNEKKLNRTQVTARIRKGILDGEWKPGDPLRQITLSWQYGESQTVIRENLTSLESHGLVSRADHVGLTVRRFSRQDLVDAFRVREVLDGLAARQ